MLLIFVLTDANEATYSIEFGSNFSLRWIDLSYVCLAGRHHHHTTCVLEMQAALVVIDETCWLREHKSIGVDEGGASRAD